ncbi:MAG: ATP-binding protein [Actinomycetota bacterium]|nr:ATP-binding protein [Actinomycetota bacterium]
MAREDQETVKPMRIAFTLRLPRDELSVPIVRHICRSALLELGVEGMCLADIELAVSEACTNVLKHAHGVHQEYEVEVEVNEESCEIRVIDAGIGFSSKEAFRQAGGSAEAGRGLHLMNEIVDNLHFISQPEQGTVVHLEKKLDLSDDSILQKLAELPIPQS